MFRATTRLLRQLAHEGINNDVTDLVFNPLKEHKVGRLWHRTTRGRKVWLRFKNWVWSL